MSNELKQFMESMSRIEEGGAERSRAELFIEDKLGRTEINLERMVALFKSDEMTHALMEAGADTAALMDLVKSLEQAEGELEDLMMSALANYDEF